MKRPFEFHFDVPSGVFLSPSLDELLMHRAREKGPTLDVYGAVVLNCSLERLTLDHAAVRVLVYQRRWLDEKFFPRVYPHLRVSIPVDFGRRPCMVWYDRAFEDTLIPYDAAIPEIDPERML